MFEIVFESNHPDVTSSLGKRIAGLIIGPVAIALNGTLGAGKTLLARELIATLGVDPSMICSPTFTICQEHVGRDWSIYHIDLYRVADEDELIELGIEQWVDCDGIAIIEWADRFPSVNQGCDLQIDIEIIGEQQREIRIRTPHERTRFPEIANLSN